MGFNYKSPQLSESDIAEIASGTGKRTFETVAPGRYNMKVRDVSARRMPSGKVVGKITLEHTEAKGATFAELTLFKAKENPALDSEVTSKFLVTMGKALGLSAAELQTITWGDSSDAEPDQYGNVPAAVLTAGANGDGEVLNIKDLPLVAILDIETFQKRDGSQGAKNIVKAIYAA